MRDGPVARAIAYIQEGVSDGRFASGARLPALRQLSALAGVSYVTMWKAVAALRSEGLLSGARRHRPVVATAGDSAPVQTQSRSTGTARGWERISHALQTQILGGRPQPGQALPPAKELCREYRVSPATMRKALADVCRSELIVPAGRGYRVSPLAIAHPTSRIALLLGTPASRTYLSLGELDTDYMRSIETECARAGVALDIYTYEPAGTAPLSLRAISPASAADPCSVGDNLGFLVMLREAPQVLATVLASLAPFARPVAVLDVTGVLTTARLMPSYPLLRVFSLALSDKPGVQLGRYLAGLGHRRVAFISPFHRQSWSQMRLRGLMRAMEEAGAPPDTVRTFVSAGSQLELEQFRARMERQADVGPLRRHLTAWAENAPDALASQVKRLAGGGLDSTLTQAGLHQEVHRLCEQALADPAVTAWVFPNDHVALIALRFLDRHSIPVPERLSVAGFDDAAESVRRRLTSYSFNVPALIAAMLRHVLSPRRNAGLPRRVVIEGTVVPRQTTAPPSRQEATATGEPGCCVDALRARRSPSST